MENKQQDSAIETASQSTNILDLYNIPADNIHCTLHNLFRGLKSIRRKYKLTINEIIFLNGMYLYCKHISTCMSQDACLKFKGYYNLGKVKYYLGSLQAKGMIQLAEVIMLAKFSMSSQLSAHEWYLPLDIKRSLKTIRENACHNAVVESFHLIGGNGSISMEKNLFGI